MALRFGKTPQTALNYANEQAEKRTRRARMVKILVAGAAAAVGLVYGVCKYEDYKWQQEVERQTERAADPLPETKPSAEVEGRGDALLRERVNVLNQHDARPSQQIRHRGRVVVAVPRRRVEDLGGAVGA